MKGFRELCELIKPEGTVVRVCCGNGVRDMDFVRRRMTRTIFKSIPGDCTDFSSIRMPNSEAA